ncbi:MAG TPA: hypothetical protein VIK91_19955 [Nannocystis sp.]
MAHTFSQIASLGSSIVLGVILAGCSSDPKPAVSGSDGTSTTEAGTTSGTGTTTGATTSTTTGAPTTSTTEPTTGDTGGIGGMCNLFLQDCPPDQKCTAYSLDGSIFPNGTRCVPVDPNPVGPGDDCVVPGEFGDGIDNCGKGSLCLDIEHDGMATCVPYCLGSMDDPVCPGANDKCAFLFEPTVPVCFTSCDPLLQNCAPGETCVPNEAVLGAPYFVCMPRVYPEIPGQYGDSCLALSGCDPGNLCIFAENVPGCTGTYCCSVWCDLQDVEPCAQYDPTLSCVPWFEPGAATPGYENVGICGIMQ